MQGRKLLAWMVHLYTALSAPLGVWAVFAIFAGDFRLAWFLLFATIILDSTDGILARAVKVWEVLPGFDGRRLDDIVDYFTWVIVPAILLVQAGLLPAWATVPPLLASCYGFAQIQAKTDDDYFLGFPSYWSLIGFYLYVFDTPVWFNTALFLFLAVMVFVPIRYPYPTKTPQLRTLTLVLGALTGAAMLAVVATLPDPPGWLAWSTLLYPAYYSALTLGLWWGRREAAA